MQRLEITELTCTNIRQHSEVSGLLLQSGPELPRVYYGLKYWFSKSYFDSIR